MAIHHNRIGLIDQERKIEIVTQQIVRARIFYDIWWFYKGSETRPEIIETLNDFSDFFRFDEHAHFVSMIVHACCIWDRNRSSVSLLNLGRAMIDREKSKESEALWRQFHECSQKFSGLKTIRDKAIAHRSGEFDYDATFRMAGVVPNTIGPMLSDSLKFANVLRAMKGIPEEDFALYPLEHIMALVATLGGPDLQPKSDLDEILGS